MNRQPTSQNEHHRARPGERANSNPDGQLSNTRQNNENPQAKTSPERNVGTRSDRRCMEERYTGSPSLAQTQVSAAANALELRKKELDRREAELLSKERRMNTAQRELKKREHEIAAKESQYDALKTTVTHLERRVSELKEENQLLIARVTLQEQGQGKPQENHTQQSSQTSSCQCCRGTERQERSSPTRQQQSPSPQMPPIIIAPNFGHIGTRDPWHMPPPNTWEYTHNTSGAHYSTNRNSQRHTPTTHIPTNSTTPQHVMMDQYGNMRTTAYFTGAPLYRPNTPRPTPGREMPGRQKLRDPEETRARKNPADPNRRHTWQPVNPHESYETRGRNPNKAEGTNTPKRATVGKENQDENKQKEPPTNYQRAPEAYHTSLMIPADDMEETVQIRTPEAANGNNLSTIPNRSYAAQQIQPEGLEEYMLPPRTDKSHHHEQYPDADR